MLKECKAIKTKYIHPDPRLIKYVKEKPLLDIRIDKLKMRQRNLDSKKRSSTEEKELREIESILIKLKSKSGVFSDDKVEILDKIIFPSMANLTFFFEAVSTISELSNFESDIRELFGVRRDNPRAYNYAFMFKALIMGMIAINEMNDEGTSGKIDFRLKLIHELQRLILSKIYLQKIVEGDKARFVVLEDVSRAMAWTEMFASRAADDYDLNKLFPRYDKTELENCKNDAERKKYQEYIDKKTLEDFEKYAKKVNIHRSFNYDFKKLIEIEDEEKFVDDIIAAIKRK